jgi:ATP-binding cassette, subfamily B, bacterial CvaB/MchF/RaxB
MFFTKSRLRYLPSIALQHRTSECGYVCIAAILGLFRIPVTTEEVVLLAGDSSRGLVLKQVRDALRKAGLQSHVVTFDKYSPHALPIPSIALLKEGHYVVVARRRRAHVEVFYPEYGWTAVPLRKFQRELSGIAISADSIDASRVAESLSSARAGQAKAADPIREVALRAFRSSIGVRCLLAGLVAQTAVMSLPLLMANLVDKLAEPAVAGPTTIVALGFLLVSVFSAFCNIVGSYASLIIGAGVSRRLSGRVMDELSLKPISWYEARPPSALAQQLGMVHSQYEFYVELPFEVARIAVTLVFGLVAVAYLSLALILPGVISIIISATVDRVLLRRIRYDSFSASVAQMQKMHMAMEVLPLIPRLKRLGGYIGARFRFQRMAQRAAATEVQRRFNQAVHASVITIVKQFEQLVFLGIAAYLMHEKSYSLGLFVAAGVYRDSLANGLGSIFSLFHQWNLLEPSRRDTMEFLTRRSLDRGPQEASIIAGRIEIRELECRYGALDEPVFRGLNFTIEAGSFVVVRGPSGSGKSTLLKAICGLLEVSDGELTIDGIDASTVVGGISYVSQSEYLVSGSILDNVVAFRRGIKDVDVWEALRVVELDDFVMSLPMRLQTVIGEGVSSMSGGQRQRVVLARAIAVEPRLLVLDEATANLDVGLEQRIMNNLKALAVTVILVSHRPEVWRHATMTVDLEAVARAPGRVEL